MISYLHLIIHFLLILISVASLFVPYFVHNKMELIKIQNELNNLRDFISKCDNSKDT